VKGRELKRMNKELVEKERQGKRRQRRQKK
jgi:hypothetical protein